MGTKEFISRLAQEVARGNDTNLSHYQSDNQRAVLKEWNKPELFSSFDKCNRLWPSLEPRPEVEIYWDKKGSHLTFCVIF